jgi:glycosyltransferase involved in cell wall biosynthesis
MVKSLTVLAPAVQHRVLLTLAVPDRTGASRMATNYCAAFLSRGHEVTVCHGPLPGRGIEGTMLGEMAAIGAELVEVPGMNRRMGLAAFRQVNETVRRITASVIVAFNQMDRPVAMWSAWRSGIPGVVSGQNQHQFHGSRLSRWLKRARYRFFLKRGMTAAICTSEAVRKELREMGVADDEALLLLPNGIDTAPYSRLSDSERNAVRAGLGLPEGCILGVNVGRLDPQKGHDVLLKAIHPLLIENPNLYLVIVGGQDEHVNRLDVLSYNEALRSFVEDHDLSERIRFAGWSDQVAGILGSGDFYVHSSRWEGPPLPLAALEGMAAGLPAVVTDCSGHPDGFVDGVHGYVVRKECETSLRKGLKSLLSHGLREMHLMGSQAQRLARERYDISVIGNYFVDVVEQVAGARVAVERGATDP